MAVITDFKLNRGENTAVAIDPTELFCQIRLLSTRKPVIHRARMTLAAPRGLKLLRCHLDILTATAATPAACGGEAAGRG